MNISISDIKFSINILQKSKISTLNSNFLEDPFFVSIIDKYYNIDNKIEKCIEQINKNKNIIELNKKLKLPLKILYIYCLLDSQDREIIYLNFIFMSFNELIKRYNIYISNNQYKLCDLAIMYLNMGNIVVLSYDITTNRFFFRYDGGSNDWDRDSNWQFIKNYNSEYNKTYSLEETFSIIDKIDKFFDYVN